MSQTNPCCHLHLPQTDPWASVGDMFLILAPNGVFWVRECNCVSEIRLKPKVILATITSTNSICCWIISPFYDFCCFQCVIHGVQTKGHPDIRPPYKRPPDKRPPGQKATGQKATPLNNSVILALYCVYTVVSANYRTSQLTSKQQFVSSFSLRARFLLTSCCTAYRQTSKRRAFGHLVSTEHDRCSSDLCSVVTHPAIQTFSLTTVQLSSHGSFVGPSCLIHICYSVSLL